MRGLVAVLVLWGAVEGVRGGGDFGQVMLADANNNRIRKIAGGDPASVVNAVVGTGFTGFSGDDALSYTASMGRPSGVRAGVAGTPDEGRFFVADTTNNRVFQVEPGGRLTTLAGKGTAGDGGPAVDAFMRFPFDLAFDAAGNLYVCEIGNPAIRVINRQGTPLTIGAVTIAPGAIVTVAGVLGSAGFNGEGGPATTVQLRSPASVELSPTTPAVYITDQINNRLRVLNRNASGGASITVLGVTIAAGEMRTVIPEPVAVHFLDAPHRAFIDPRSGGPYDRAMLRMLKEAIRRTIPFRSARFLERTYAFGMDAVDALTGPGYGPLPPRRAVRSVYWFRRNGARYRRLLIDIGGLKPDDRVLDVGCWYGRIAVPLAHVLSRRGRLEGVDVDRPAVDWCRSYISPRHSNCFFHWLDVRNPTYNPSGTISPERVEYPYEEASFDFVFGIALLEGLPVEVMDRTMSEMSRVLRPGGRCFTTWYLLNEESRRVLREKRARPVFIRESGELLERKSSYPKRGYACDEGFALSLFAKHGWRILGPIRYGTWCGRGSGTAYKDLIVASR